MEKVRGGGDFCSLFLKIKGEAKISLIIVASVSSQIILYTASG